MFKPFGNLVRLPDGRTLRKQATGGWIDVNTGVKMNDTMVGNLMYSSVFYGVPDGGVGKTPRATIIGIIGSVTITQWLQQTRSSTDSLDMVFIGDSNVAYSDGGGAGHNPGATVGGTGRGGTGGSPNGNGTAAQQNSGSGGGGGGGGNGNGGDGGSWGAASGGAGGSCTSGAATYITWVATGTRYGAIN
jgi:hypothetical protein